MLLADSKADLAQLMSLVSGYARQWRFQVNHGKCGLMRFTPSGSSQLPSEPIALGDRPVQWVAVYKYLGVELHNGVPFTHYRARALRSAQRAMGAVSGMGLYSGKLPVPLAVQLYKALVRPLLEYGAEVASVQQRAAVWDAAEQLQTTMAKRILACPVRTSTAAVQGELGLHCMEARFLQLRLGFWGKLMRMDSSEPARLVYAESERSMSMGPWGEEAVPSVSAADGWAMGRPAGSQGGLTPWPAQIKRDLFGTGLERYWNSSAAVSELSQEQWRGIVKTAVHSREQARWWREAQAIRSCAATSL